MPCDYEAIRRGNERRYGTDIGRFGPMLLADRYDDRSHFIFELWDPAGKTRTFTFDQGWTAVAEPDDAPS